jgi:hypothetical protein
VEVVCQKQFVGGVEPSSLDDHLLGVVDMAKCELVLVEEDLNHTLGVGNVGRVEWRREKEAKHILESDMGMVEVLVDVGIVACVDAVIAYMDSVALVFA